MTDPTRRYSMTLFLVCVIALITYRTGVDGLRYLTVFIEQQFGIDKVRIGIHGAGQAFAGVFGAILFALLADYIGRRLVFIVAMTGFGLFALATGYVSSYQWYMGTTQLLFFFGTVVSAIILAELGERWPHRSLATVYGVIITIMALSAILSVPIMEIAKSGSWTDVIIGAGVLAIIIAVAGFPIFKKSILSPVDNNCYPWRQSAFWHLIAGTILVTITVRNTSVFSPAILTHIFNTSVEYQAYALGLWSLGATIIGTIAGGVLGDIWLRKNLKAHGLLAAVAAAIVAGAVVAMAFITTGEAAKVIFIITGFAGSLWIAPVYATVMRLSTAKYRTIVATLIIVFIPTVVAVHAPTIIGLFSGLDWLGEAGNKSLRLFSGILAGFAFWALIHFWLAARATARALPTMAVESNKAMEPATIKKGIRGWLIIPAISLPLSLIAHMFNIGTVATLDWSALDQTHARIMTTSILLDSTLLIIGSITTLLFFMQKRIGIICTCFYLVIIPVFTMIMLVMTADSELIKPDGYVHAIRRGATGVAIWLPYFVISKRVKATFIN